MYIYMSMYNIQKYGIIFCIYKYLFCIIFNNLTKSEIPVLLLLCDVIFKYHIIYSIYIQIICRNMESYFVHRNMYFILFQ